MKKVNCNNLFCIMTTKDKTWEWRDAYLENNQSEEILKDGGVFVFCEGSDSVKSHRLKEVVKGSVFNLEVPFEEKYSNLAEKTYLSIKYCVRRFNFNYYLKCDDTKKLSYNLLKERLNENKKDFFGLSCDRAKKTRGGFTQIRNLSEGLRATKRRNFARWAHRRGINVDVNYWDEHAWYANWKPYAMSYRFSKIISNAGVNYVKLYNDHLGGCEDHMIGKIKKDLTVAFDLV